MVDDGSEDNSVQIALEFTKDPRFSLIRQTNAGVSAARNRALQEVKGEWITFVDSDDFLALDFYSLLLQNQLFDKYDLILCGYTESDADGHIKGRHIPRTVYQFVSPCMRLIKRDFLMHNQLRFEEGQRYEDVLFAIDTWIACPRMLLTHITGYHYRLHGDSFTAQRHPIGPLFGLIDERLKQHKPKLWLYGIIVYTKLRLLLHIALRRR